MIVRKLGIADYPAVNALFAVAFETTPENGPAREEDEGVRHWGVFSEDGDLMSSLTATPFSMRFDGAACPMAGIGAVQTLPPYRRRGGIAACFERALPELYESGFLFAYLYPFSTAFYRRFGFESCVTALVCTVDLSQLRLPPDTGYFRLATKEKPLFEAIRQVDRAWERMWNMEVLRGEGDYAWLDKLDPLATREYLYVCFDASGAPRGYIAFRTAVEAGERALVCSRFRFMDKAGFYALLSVCKSLAADHRLAKFTLPSDPALPYLMGEWSLGAASFSRKPAGMLRVIHVAEVLRRAAYRGDGALRLGIRDGLIPENDSVFDLVFAHGRAVSVERTDANADAVMDIASFSALIAGVCDFDGARNWMDGLEIIDPAAPFEGVFYRKSMMISEYF